VGADMTAPTTACIGSSRLGATKRARVPVHAYVPMSFAPGEAYQFRLESRDDHACGPAAGWSRRRTLKLSHSRMPFVRVYFRETQELVV